MWGIIGDAMNNKTKQDAVEASYIRMINSSPDVGQSNASVYSFSRMATNKQRGFKMEHNIKLNRAKSMAKLRPRTEWAIFDLLTGTCPGLVDRLSAKDIGDVAKALDAHWQAACIRRERDIIDDGYVWDTKSERMFLVAPEYDEKGE